MPSWNDLNKPKAVRHIGDDEFSVVCAQMKLTVPGRKFLEMLHETHINAVLPGEPSDRALLIQAGKRQLVRAIEDAAERGEAFLSRDKKA